MLLWQSLPRLASFALDRTFLYDLKSFKSWKFSFRRCYAQCKQRSVEDFKFKIFFFFILGGDGERWQLFALFTLKPTSQKNKNGNVVRFVWRLGFILVFIYRWRCHLMTEFRSRWLWKLSKLPKKKKKTSVLERKYKAPFYRASLYFVRSVLCTVCTQFF